MKNELSLFILMDKVTEAERVLVTFQGEAITGKAEV
jgi:hypothetical protein